MRRFLMHVLLALALLAVGLPMAPKTNASPMTVNFLFNAEANIGGTIFGTGYGAPIDVSGTGGPLSISWDATSQGVPFTATVVYTVLNMAPLAMRFDEFRYRTQDGSASGTVPIGGVVASGPNVNHTEFSFARSMGGIPFLFDGAISIPGSAATLAGGGLTFGTSMTDAAHAINPGSTFPASTSALYARSNVYNVPPDVAVKTQWYFNSSPYTPSEGPVGAPNSWFTRGLCVITAGHCDPSQAISSGVYELHVSIGGTEVLVGAVIVGSASATPAGAEAPGQTQPIEGPALSHN